MIIGIAGKSQSGKDTTAMMINFLRQYPDVSFHTYWETDFPLDWDNNTIVHYADLLKDVSETMLSLPRFTLQSQIGKSSTIEWLDGMTCREFLQKLGTAVRNEVHPDFWVRALINRRLRNNEKLTIVPDVRFPNEAEAIKNNGGFLIRMEREGAGAGDHISETALDNYTGWDLVIDNNDTLEALYKTIQNLLSGNAIPLE